MQVRCNNSRGFTREISNEAAAEIFNFLFTAKGVSTVYDSFSNKTDAELEEVVADSSEMVIAHRKVLAKALCTLRNRMSDYRFEKMLKRQRLSKEFAKKSVELGAKLFEQGED